MERTKDWKAIVAPRVLIVGENSTLQWSDEVIEYVMFLDYYFRNKPYDHGERSRYTEAASILKCVNELSADRYRPQHVCATNLSIEILARPLKGKHILIPERDAIAGVKRINKIITDNPSIETVFVMSVQANYWLQKLGLYASDAAFLHGAQPRTVGIESDKPYYQPVDPKAFNSVCGNIYQAQTGTRTINVVPILPAKDYPLYGLNEERFSAAYDAVKAHFASLEQPSTESTPL